MPRYISRQYRQGATDHMHVFLGRYLFSLFRHRSLLKQQRGGGLHEIRRVTNRELNKVA